MSLDSTEISAATPPDVAVAYCSDSLMEVPLHVSAFSLLTHLAPGIAPHFYMLLTGFAAEMRAQLARTLDRAGRPYRLTFLSDEKTSFFQAFRALLGNYAPYYRLLLPELIEERKYLYIDSDTLPLIDVAPLFSLDLGGHAAGFVIDGQVKTQLDRPFMLAIGRDLEAPAFNSGVMFVDREEWKRQGLGVRVPEFCQKHGEQLISHDQTVLNALLADDSYYLPAEYNVKIYPKRTSTVGREPGLYHFLGSPKPWDFLGRTMLPYSSRWYEILKTTALPTSKKSLWMNSAYWKRAPKVVGGYYRMLKGGLKK